MTDDGRTSACSLGHRFLPARNGTRSNSLDRIATVNNSPRRPAHRPSRRSSVIDAAIGLFATYPAEAITVADIAAAANMTAAAVYYHFPSKESGAPRGPAVVHPRLPDRGAAADPGVRRS